MLRQVKFCEKNHPDKIFGGIQFSDGDIICGCCGGIFEQDDNSIRILEIYDTWIDLTETITGE